MQPERKTAGEVALKLQTTGIWGPGMVASAVHDSQDGRAASFTVELDGQLFVVTVRRSR